MKVLSENEYKLFFKDYTEAMMSLEDKEKKVNAVCDKIERNLFLIGTTIVEDKLQEKVPETIRDLRLAQIKVWMLTGDKMNTAYNIGLSCNLINKEMKIFSICGIEPKKDELTLSIMNQQERADVIINFAKEFQQFKGEYDTMTLPQYGILVDEKALLTIEEEEQDIKNIFLDIAKDAVAVICCRVSPLQKSQVVKMMKNYNPNSKTLAIGDGGNDVSMIMEAHIGVGIYGEEGLRAVQNSDYAIGEFRFLHELLLYHGRTNYMRNAQCILYFFYKNFVFTFLQFVFGFYCNFTGQTIIDDWFITLFNLLFTSLPLGARALLDHDVKPEDGEIINLMLPFLYLENRTNPYFTMRRFFLNLLKGIIQSIINFFFVIYMLDESINKNGQMGGLWFCSVNLYTNILIIVSVELLLNTKYHTWINFVILGVITFVAYIIFLIIVHNMSMFNSYGTMYVAFNSGKLWLNLLFVGGTCCLIDFFLISYRYIFSPSLKTQLQVLVNQKQDMKISNINSMPKLIKEVLGIYGEFNATQDVDFIETKKFQDNKVDVKINNKESEQIKINKEKDKNDNTELMKIKNNKSRADKNDKKIDEAPVSNDNELNNLYYETKTKNVNKGDVVIVKGQNSNEEIIEEDYNSKEAFLK
jgi:phospholipid-transporting ATPase